MVHRRDARVASNARGNAITKKVDRKNEPGRFPWRVKLFQPIVVAEEKVINYLLVRRDEDDKSSFLEQAGYSLTNPGQLLGDLRALATKEAEFVEKTDYGDKYRIRGILIGPNGKNLKVISIWMTEETSGITKFITLFPDRI